MKKRCPVLCRPAAFSISSGQPAYSRTVAQRSTVQKHYPDIFSPVLAFNTGQKIS